jgi:hypothetical protein
MTPADIDTLKGRAAPLDMSAAAFRASGHDLVDQIANWLERMPHGPVMRDESPGEVRRALGADRGLPEAGTDAGALLSEAAQLLFDHSLFNGHPVSSATSPRVRRRLARSVSAGVSGHANVGAWRAGADGHRDRGPDHPLIAELIGFPRDTGGCS